MNLKETGWNGVDWFCAAKSGDKWQAHVKTKWNFEFHKMGADFWLAEELFVSEEKCCSSDVVSYIVEYMNYCTLRHNRSLIKNW